MKSSILISALLLCSLSWISASDSGIQTVKVQTGGEATLLCANISEVGTQTDWFRVVNRTKPRCISSMYNSDGKASFCDGFQSGKFEMSSNGSTVFLKVKPVASSDSGLYFCGFYIGKHTVITSAAHLNIEGNSESDDGKDFNNEKESDGMTNLMIIISVTLAALTLFFTTVIIVLAVKIRKLQTAVKEPQAERNKNLDSDGLTYAAISFQAKPKRNRRAASERELEPNVVYAATR